MRRLASCLAIGFVLCRSAAGQPAPLAAPQPAPPDNPAPARPALPTTPEPPAPAWAARNTAFLQVLDKLNGQATTLSVKVGGQGAFRSLTVAVLACYERPPDQPADATALLTITTSAAPAPVYRGWMLAAEPAAAMMQDPVYDVRVLSCQ